MAGRIAGPLHREVIGPVGAPNMIFVHPNPMDHDAWMYQLAHLSTWFRCVAVDLPGYGLSPTTSPDVSLFDIADACWEAAEEGPAILVGCSVGANVVEHMYHRAPDRTRAVVVAGAGFATAKPYLQRHIDAYGSQGLAYRYEYTLNDFSPSFRATPIARWFADMFMERNATADVDSILAMFRALIQPDPEWLAGDLNAPVLIITGSEDSAHQRAFALRDRLPDGELVTMEGAGHACQIERPWEFDRHLLDFLARRGLADGVTPIRPS